MTDKEKIRAEIERRIEELQPCNTRENLRAHGAIAGYYQILSFINSMQEEPVSDVWHDAQTDTPQAKRKILATNEYGACEVDYAINMALYWPKVIKWAYIDDLLNL